MNETLVIHPKDLTTDFLSDIYSDKEWDIINYDCSDSLLKNQIKKHGRIIMMGHGIPFGLLGYSKLVINSNFIYLLRDLNKYYVYIWCNADMFVKKYDLFGFYTGMIVSEVMEAKFFNINTTYDQINYSNMLFARSIKDAIDTDNILRNTLNRYIGNNNPIIQFNRKHIYEIYW
jgi:hypothetical protein